MKLHVACGNTYLDGWVNCDLRDDVRVDMRVDCMDKLPFPTGSVTHLRADDFLEHVPPSRLDLVLSEWRRVCASNAEVEVRVPNLRAIAESLAASNDQRWHELLIRNIYGGHRWGPDGAWDAHHSGWTPDLLLLLLARYGFRVVSNDGELNMTVKAHAV